MNIKHLNFLAFCTWVPGNFLFVKNSFQNYFRLFQKKNFPAKRLRLFRFGFVFQSLSSIRLKHTIVVPLCLFGWKLIRREFGLK